MPDQTNAENALRKLGQRLREGFANKYPVTEKSLQTVRDSIREQMKEKSQVKREPMPAPTPSKTRVRKPSEPEQER